MFQHELTKHLAELSKIEFSEDELEKMTLQMADIIHLMDKVKDFDGNSTVYALDAKQYDQLRTDAAQESFPAEKILQNAKQVKNNSFTVPKVV